MYRAIAIVSAMLMAGGAWAQSGDKTRNVASEINSYEEIIVEMSPSAPECNLVNPAKFQTRMDKQLSALGVNQDDESGVHAVVGVTAVPLSAERCAATVEVQFRIWLTPADVGAADAVRYVSSFERFPVIIYKSGYLISHPKDVMEHFVGESIEKLIDDFKQKRVQE